MIIRFRNRITPLWLLGLFLFTLIYTGVHQFNNPAPEPEDCILANNHIHGDPEIHKCELCDFQVTALLEVPPPLSSIGQIVDRYLEKGTGLTSKNQLYHPYLRGPPLS